MIGFYSGINLYVSLEKGVNSELLKSINEKLSEEGCHPSIRVGSGHLDFQVGSEYYLDITLGIQDMDAAIEAAKAVVILLGEDVFVQLCKEGVNCWAVKVCEDETVADVMGSKKETEECGGLAVTCY